MSSKPKMLDYKSEKKNPKPSWSRLKPVTGYPKFLTEFLATLMHFGIRHSKTEINNTNIRNFITANFKVKN